MESPYPKQRPQRPRRFFPLFFVLGFMAITWIVYWLWNNVLIAVVPVKPLTYWQAMGVLVLSRILCGGFKFGPPGGRFGDGYPNWREKWRNMSEDERARFKEEWRSRRRGHWGSRGEK